ncbi:nucleoprotein TPR [Oncorhynchus tshawytscha]|uniref:nucleoprotein TPR n=1 Tax=Oncorhynchus tshawytscha TaxID=74940 RepID=UPI000D0A5ED4|nr:nucleoprotein TPR [Oncorhynchus tshawytscha]
MPGSKSTPRASIRPIVPVTVPTPTATAMPHTQSDSQEASAWTPVRVACPSPFRADPLPPVLYIQPPGPVLGLGPQPTQRLSAIQEWLRDKSLNVLEWPSQISGET